MSKIFEIYNNNTLSFWITIIFKKNKDATQILRKDKIFLSSQSKAIKLNGNSNTFVAIFSMNLLTKIEREKKISNLFFIESKREGLSEIWKQ